VMNESSEINLKTDAWVIRMSAPRQYEGRCVTAAGL
jgi:hypothetical protein